MTIVYNWIFGVLSLSSLKENKSPVELATRYFFSQFWTEFSRDVLQEFFYADSEHVKAMKIKQDDEKMKKNDLMIEKQREK